MPEEPARLNDNEYLRRRKAELDKQREQIRPRYPELTDAEYDQRVQELERQKERIRKAEAVK